jgi:hypothetical protein
MRALSIRQPFAELILRGVKTVEYRSRPTRIVGERFWIYASMGRSPKPGAGSRKVWADNIVVPTEAPPRWMVELAEQVGMIEPDADLPRGVIVGSAVIERCEAVAGDQLPVRSADNGFASASDECWISGASRRASRL